MEFTVEDKGAISVSSIERIFQASHEVHTFILNTSYSASATINIAFMLSNGDIVDNLTMTYDSLDGQTGLHKWTYLLTDVETAEFGATAVSFYISTGTKIVSTPRIYFYIESTVDVFPLI